MRLARLSLGAVAAAAAGCWLGCGAPAGPPPSTAPAPQETAPDEAPTQSTPAAKSLDANGTYLQPNVELPDGSLAFVHVSEADMPLRIAIGYPPSPPKYASRDETRNVAIEAMRMWEHALQPHVPWFRLEFVEKDDAAAVQIQWRRRITGPWAGFGEIRWMTVDGRLQVGGRMQVSTTPGQFYTLEIEEVRLLIAHEFGHVLGLGHCHECDSAMNYSWETRKRVFVTETDVRTFLALLAQPNLTPSSE